LGIVEIVERNPTQELEGTSPTLVSYLPHQPVIREDKATTKVRIVYDASAHAKGCKSLNNCLYRGPVFLPDLAGMLLRFRTGKIVVTADFEKAFLQISLKNEDRDVTRFLWFKDPRKGLREDNIQTLRFTRICFGVISSPFILAATIREHLDRVGTPLANEIKQNIYSDNVLIVADTPQEAIQKCNEAKAIFLKANMNLREFVSNCSKVNENFDVKHPPENTKFMGIKWDPLEDNLHFQIKVTEKDYKSPPTKRKALSKMAEFFDPLGLLCPFF